MYLLPILLFLGAGASLSAQDMIPPTALCKAVTVQLDASGQAQIAPSDINNGSTDNITPASSLGLSLDISNFDCTNGWQPIGSRGIPAVGSTDFQSLALAPDGTPYVAYIDRSDGGKVTVRRWDGSNWIALGGSGISADRVFNRNLAIGIAPDGTPFVAYEDNSVGGKATVRRWNGSGWDYLGGVGVSQGRVGYLSMAIAPDGTPYLAYFDAFNRTKTTVLKWSGSSWSALGGAGISGGQAADQSMAIAPDGTPYVAYRDNPFGTKTTVLKWNGSTWSELGGRGISPGKASHQSLAIAPDGTPYVAYRDELNSDKTTVLKWNGSSWGTLGGVGISAGYAESQSMAIAPDGTPYVAYEDRAAGYPYVTRVLSWNGSSWSELSRIGITKGQSYKQSLVIAPDGTPHLAYRDDANSQKTTVIRLNNFTTLTVTDVAGNSSTCKARVRVTKQAPTALCQDITVQMETYGFAWVSPEDVDNGSDVCNALDLSVSPPFFICPTSGVNTVTLTVSDGSNNTASCAASALVLTGALSLNGDDTIRICQGQNYTDQGALYTDYCISFDDPVVGNTSQVNTNQTGTYTVTYDYTDPNGNPSNQITRTVIVDLTSSLPTLAQQGCGSCGQIRSNTCQFVQAPDLDAYVMANANYVTGAALNWYEDNNNAKGAPLLSAPTVNTAQVATNWYWVEQQLGDCSGPAIRVRVRVKKLFTPDFNLPALGCGGSAQVDLAAWVSDPKKKAKAYTFYAVDPATNPGATPLGTATAKKGVVNFGQYVLVNVSNGSQTFWVQSTVPNGCGGITSSTLNAPAQTAVLNPIGNQTYDSGDAVNIAFSGQNATLFLWYDLAIFANPNIGMMGTFGLGNLAFTATNATASSLTATIRVIPYNGNCAGQFQDFTITVDPVSGPRHSAGNSLQFTASRINSHDVVLNWDIMYEFDLLRFEVEKKKNDDQFVAIDEVAWTGNGSYQFTDQSGMGNSNQYRLKMVLTDGRIVWSETVEVNMDFMANDLFSIFPNPNTGKFQLKALFPLEETYSWQLTDVMGKVVITGQLQQQEMTISTSQLAAGVYHLTIVSADGKRYINKIINQ